jgi:hypothetical protein
MRSVPSGVEVAEPVPPGNAAEMRAASWSSEVVLGSTAMSTVVRSPVDWLVTCSSKEPLRMSKGRPAPSAARFAVRSSTALRPVTEANPRSP